MSSTPAEGFEVHDLDPAGVLAAAAATERESRRVELRRLRLAAQWCVLHPATSDTGVATWNPDTSLPGVLDLDESLGGDGTPAVAAFAPEAFAAAMEMTPVAGAQLLADALDLQFRLLRLWERVHDLDLPSWQARTVAQHTHGLPLAGARWVDDRLAERIHGWGSVVLDRLVADAVARFDPQEHARREDRGKGSWDVTLTHPSPTEFAGTSELHARGDTLDLTQFYALVTETAHELKNLGDTDDLGARKAKALGVLADLANGQAALDLQAALTGPGSGSGKVRLYVRVDADDLDTTTDTTGSTGTTDSTGSTGVGEVERLGPATIAKIKEWVGHARVTVVPVLDLGRSDAVDRHDPPAWMREVVILRDGHCVFPGCRRDARSCDLDHIQPYVSPDDGGPPGQTSPDRLACLCRRHHRAKTLGLWTYQRAPDHAGYLWHGPHGAAYLVTPDGTLTLPTN